MGDLGKVRKEKGIGLDWKRKEEMEKAKEEDKMEKNRRGKKGNTDEKKRRRRRRTERLGNEKRTLQNVKYTNMQSCTTRATIIFRCFMGKGS